MARYRKDFLDKATQHNDSTFFFVHGMLTDAAKAAFMKELVKLRHFYAELHKDSLKAGLGKRRGTGLMLALSHWEPDDSARLRRSYDETNRGKS